MLSYRHAFHAGNFADVLKHVVLVALLDHLAAKDKPFLYLETHAGAGRYDLGSPAARQNREHAGGIGRLWGRSDLPAAVARYLALVREHNGPGRLRHYPGSPWFAQRLLRPQDRLVVYELHPAEVGPLATLLAGDRRGQVLAEDGFAGINAQLPPRERRALVLLDPAYEVKHDYRQVIETLAQAHRRFATGTYAIWYPVVDRHRIDAMERGLVKSGIHRVHQVELDVGPGDGRMTACGLLLVNPPWTLPELLAEALPWLARVLGNEGHGRFLNRELIGEG